MQISLTSAIGGFITGAFSYIGLSFYVKGLKAIVFTGSLFSVAGDVTLLNNRRTSIAVGVSASILCYPSIS